MRPRVRIPPCKFCAKTFRRTEHLRRHERTHTKEKPFKCSCGQAFSRGDLLTRHSRLAHDENDSIVSADNESQDVLMAHIVEDGDNVPDRTAADENAARTSPKLVRPGAAYPSETITAASLHPQARLSPLISTDVADTPAISSTSIPFPPSMPNVVSEYEDTILPNDQPLAAPLTSLGYNEQATNETCLMDQPPWGFSSGDDLDLLWREMEVTSSLTMPYSFAANYPMNLLSMTHHGISGLGMTIFPEERHSNVRQDSGSPPGFRSRLPSIQPSGDYDGPGGENINGTSDASRGLLQPPSASSNTNILWRLSKEDYSTIYDVIENHRSILPTNFTVPSRHALCRYVEGYFSGFHEHLPFIHLPTFSLASEAPELILAIASTGARYRFQRRQSHNLYLAARSLVDEQLRQRDGTDLPRSVFSTPGLLLDGSLHSHSPSNPADAHTLMANSYSPSSTPENRYRDMKTMQAMIILIALGTWNNRSLIKDAFSTASQLALIVREDGLTSSDLLSPDLSWKEWIDAEGRRRTKLVSFCFLNLHCIAYNIPPKLMNSEIGQLGVPSPESHWRAENGEDWAMSRSRDTHVEMTVQKSYNDLFPNAEDVSAKGTLSSFGNYVLVHCIVQQIFLTRQLSFPHSKPDRASVPSDLLLQFESTLRVWQQNWEATKDSSLDPTAPGGPLSFNSTALFRLAYIRLHADFGPHRQLETRDAKSIARAFYNAPLLERSSSVGHAVLQSAHSLSIPVRIGIEFVARTQTLNWSIVHSLCNLECGLFLGKWLETIASALARGESMQEDEKRLMGIVASIINETELGSIITSESDDVRRVKRMAVAVLRLWAYSFKGAHVFDIMGTIGAGLDLCADMLQQELDGMR